MSVNEYEISNKTPDLRKLLSFLNSINSYIIIPSTHTKKSSWYRASANTIGFFEFALERRLFFFVLEYIELIRRLYIEKNEDCI